MSDLVENPEDRVSRVAAQIELNKGQRKRCLIKLCEFHTERFVTIYTSSHVLIFSYSREGVPNVWYIVHSNVTKMSTETSNAKYNVLKQNECLKLRSFKSTEHINENGMNIPIPWFRYVCGDILH